MRMARHDFADFIAGKVRRTRDVLVTNQNWIKAVKMRNSRAEMTEGLLGSPDVRGLTSD